MKGIKGFGAIIAAALFGAFFANAGPAMTSAISLLTGPQPTADTVSIVNNLINNINRQASPTGPGNASESIYVPSCSACVNWVSLSGSVSASTAASNTALLASFGPQANISLSISPQGASGRIRFSNPNNLLASSGGSVPSGFAPTIKKWLTIEDSSGVSGIVPIYGNL